MLPYNDASGPRLQRTKLAPWALALCSTLSRYMFCQRAPLSLPSQQTIVIDRDPISSEVPSVKDAKAWWDPRPSLTVDPRIGWAQPSLPIRVFPALVCALDACPGLYVCGL